MAKKKCRVLVDCAHGTVNDIVMADDSEIDNSSDLDSSVAAVKYAESLEKETEKSVIEEKETR